MPSLSSLVSVEVREFQIGSEDGGRRRRRRRRTSTDNKATQASALSFELGLGVAINENTYNITF